MKRFLSLLLVVAMVVSLGVCCVPASAEKADKAAANASFSDILAVVKEYAGNLDANTIAQIVGMFNDLKENGIPLSTDDIIAIVGGLAGDTVDTTMLGGVVAAVSDMIKNGVSFDKDAIMAIINGFIASAGEGTAFDSEVINVIVAAAADAFQNGFSFDADTIAAIAAGLAGNVIEGVEIDPAMISAVIAGISDIKEKGLDLDAGTIADIVSALAERVIGGDTIKPDTVRALVMAIADAIENGLSLDSEAIRDLIISLVGNETYAQVMVAICNVTGNYPMKDIADNEYRDRILEAYYLGLVKGYPDGTFRPENVVTRPQFITMLYRADGEPAVSGTLNFTDADEIAADFTDAVIWGTNKGIILGYKDGSFRPYTNISRAQLATFLYRYMVNEKGFSFGNVPALKCIDKADIAADYLTAITAICSKNIMTNYDNGAFIPDGIVNRAHAASAILGAYHVLNGLPA